MTASLSDSRREHCRGGHCSPIAGDTIGTVAISPTFTSVGVLAGIVLIRTFLSATLTVEIEGRWPWQARAAAASDAR